jgi:MFS family permease
METSERWVDMKLLKFLKSKELSLILEDKRLRLILIYTICSGFVLWYGIEKVFLKNTLNLSLTQIASLPLAYMLVSLVLELPSSVLSDRWSRSKTLALSTLCLMISSILASVSNSYLAYLIVAIVWGMASSFYSGTAEALVYDCLKEAGIQDKYLKVNVLFQRIFSLSLFISISLGGLLLAVISPRLIYFLQAPTALIGIVAILKIKEPTFHQQSQESTAYKHMVKTFKSALNNRLLGSRILFSALIVSIYANYVYEFESLSFLSIRVPAQWIGLLTAISGTLSYFILGGLVDRFKARFWQPLLMLISVLFVILAFISTHWIVLLISMFTLLLTKSYSEDINNAKIHDMASSSERASAASLSGFLGGILAVICWPLLNFSMNKFGDNGYLLVSAFVGVIALALSLYVYSKQKT